MKWSVALRTLMPVLACACSQVWADAAADVAALRSEWDTVNFTLNKDDQVKPLEALIQKAAAVNKANPGNAPALIWEGIIHATYAGAKGGLGALGECCRGLLPSLWASTSSAV